MNKTELVIDDITLKLEIAATDEDRKKGLSGRDTIDDESGMLFVFPKPGKHSMWMKDTLFPLEILFIDEQGKILEIVTGEVGNETLIHPSSDKVKYVLELPVGTSEIVDLQAQDDLQIGELPEVEQENEILEQENADAEMKLLDETGNVQMNLKGKERVFSQEKTKQMVDKAKIAESDADLIELGKLVAEEIIAQDTRPEEFTEDTGRKIYDKPVQAA